MTPLYILCSSCEAVPVLKAGDVCEACERRRRKIEREQEQKAAAKLRRDTTKRTSLKNWLDHWVDR